MNRKHQRAEMALHRERVSDSFHELLAGTEDLLRSTATYTGSEIEAARARLKRQVAEARESAGDWEGAARERAPLPLRASNVHGQLQEIVRPAYEIRGQT